MKSNNLMLIRSQVSLRFVFFILKSTPVIGGIGGFLGAVVAAAYGVFTEDVDIGGAAVGVFSGVLVGAVGGVFFCILRAAKCRNIHLALRLIISISSFAAGGAAGGVCGGWVGAAGGAVGVGFAAWYATRKRKDSKKKIEESSKKFEELFKKSSLAKKTEGERSDRIDLQVHRMKAKDMERFRLTAKTLSAVTKKEKSVVNTQAAAGNP